MSYSRVFASGAAVGLFSFKLLEIISSFGTDCDSVEGTLISGGFKESNDLYGVTVVDVSFTLYVAGLFAEKLTNSKEPS